MEREALKKAAVAERWVDRNEVIGEAADPDRGFTHGHKAVAKEIGCCCKSMAQVEDNDH